MYLLRCGRVQLDADRIAVLVGQLDLVAGFLNSDGVELGLQIHRAGRQVDYQRIVAVANDGS